MPDTNTQALTDDAGRVVTLRWPHCLEVNRISKVTLGKAPVFIGRTSLGVESRQRISPIARGFALDLELRWIGEADDGIDEFYEFWFDRTGGDWNVFTIDDSNIPCLIPGWNAFKVRLPSQLWRFEVSGSGEGGYGGLELRPSGCCAFDFDVRLINIVLPDSDYINNQINQQQVSIRANDPTAATPKIK